LNKALKKLKELKADLDKLEEKKDTILITLDDVIDELEESTKKRR